MPAGKQFRKRITARETGNFLILHESHRVENVCAPNGGHTNTARSPRRVGLKLGYGYPAERSIDPFGRPLSARFFVDRYLTAAGAFANSDASGVIIARPSPLALLSRDEPEGQARIKRPY